jgi:hypothetical protein
MISSPCGRPDRLEEFATAVSCAKCTRVRCNPCTTGDAYGPAKVQKAQLAERNAGTGSGQDGIRIGTVARTHLALTSSRPGPTRVSPHSPERKRYECPAACHRAHPSRRSFGTTRRIRNTSGSHLGSTLGSGKSCPDPGRLSTFGVSGLYPCRRLTYRGACHSMLALRPTARQTP